MADEEPGKPRKEKGTYEFQRRPQTRRRQGKRPLQFKHDIPGANGKKKEIDGAIKTEQNPGNIGDVPHPGKLHEKEDGTDKEGVKTQVFLPGYGKDKQRDKGNPRQIAHVGRWVRKEKKKVRQ